MDPYFQIIPRINATDYTDGDKTLLLQAAPRRVYPAAFGEVRALLAERLPVQTLRMLLAKLPPARSRALRG